jgi:large subunit ribosomal protein L18e
MAKKLKKTNPALIALINDLKKQSQDHDVRIWKDIACRLEKPLRNWPVVTLDHLNTTVQDKETALVPGKVLSQGNLSKKIEVAAWAFSEKSKEKITKAGGKTLTIQELIKNNPDGKNIRIVG